MRYAIEIDGICSNIILADSLETASHIASLSGATARLLGEREMPVMAEPDYPLTPSAITEISRHQAKIALLNRGLLDSAEALVTASGNRALQIAWAEAPSFSRNSPSLLQIAAALNLTENDVGALFAEAQAVVV